MNAGPNNTPYTDIPVLNSLPYQAGDYTTGSPTQGLVEDHLGVMTFNLRKTLEEGTSPALAAALEEKYQALLERLEKGETLPDLIAAIDENKNVTGTIPHPLEQFREEVAGFGFSISRRSTPRGAGRPDLETFRIHIPAQE